MTETYRPGTIGAGDAEFAAKPENVAAFAALLARYEPESRTARQLRATRGHFGLRCALAHVPGSECEICGAIPGFTHHPGCTNDKYRGNGVITLGAAVAESNASARAERDAREVRAANPLEAAARDRDVALADARDAEERAVERAATVRARAVENAETTYRAACQRVERDTSRQRADVSLYASMGDADVVELLRMETFRLHRAATRMRPEVRVESGVKVAALRAELTHRGIDIPTWRFQVSS
jgi:hypothetical protein